MAKLLLRIVLVFVVITVVAGFFIGDFLSKENDQMWERYKEKPALVTAEQLETEQTPAKKADALTPVEDDKNTQVLRIETLSFGDKLVSFVPENNIAGATSLNIISEVLGRPKTVKPFNDDCGIHDVSIVDFGNIQFKKVRAEYYLYSVTLANSKFELRTPRLLINKETKLEDFKKVYVDKTAVLDMNKEPLTQNITVSETQNGTTTKKDKKKTKGPKTTDLTFLSSGENVQKWIVSFDSKGIIKSVTQDDVSCKIEPSAEASVPS